MASQAENIATLIANQNNIKERVDKIIPYVESGFHHRVEVLSELSSIKAQMSTYQANCDKDRIDLKDNVEELKLSHARERGKNSAYAAGIAFVMTIIGWFVGSK